MTQSDPDLPIFQRLIAACSLLVSAPVETLRRFFQDLVNGDERLRNADGFADFGLGLLTLPIRLVSGCFNFAVFSWASTRSGLAFLLGVPSVVCIMGYLGGIWASDILRSPPKMLAINEAYFQMNTEKWPDKPEFAEIFARRLVAENPDENEYKYSLALTLDRAGEEVDAMKIMNHLAPIDRAGFGKAHLWLANRRLGEVIGSQDAVEGQELVQPDELALQHFELARQSLPDTNIEPLVQLASIYESYSAQRANDDPKKLEYLTLADDYYQKVVKENFDFEAIDQGTPEAIKQNALQIQSIRPATRVRMKLAEMKPEEYSKELLKQQVKSQIDKLTTMVKLRQAENTSWWAILIYTKLELDDYAGAMEIVTTALQNANLDETKQRLIEMAADIQIRQATSIKGLSEKANYANRFLALSNAVSNKSKNNVLFLLLLDFVAEPRRDPKITELEAVPINADWLRSMGVGSKSTGLVHALVGIGMMSEGNFVEGRKNWEIGSSFDPRTSDYINSLLRTAAREPQPRFSNLLDMMTLAIEMFSKKPELYFTRGSYLKELKRFDEAIIDFEYCCKVAPNDFSALEVLRLSYKAIENSEKELETQLRIESILSTMDDQMRKRATMIMSQISERF